MNKMDEMYCGGRVEVLQHNLARTSQPYRAASSKHGVVKLPNETEDSPKDVAHRFPR